MKCNQNNCLLLATRNQGKIKELGAMLKSFDLDVIGLDHFPELEDVEETGKTFAENALLKARYASMATGLYAVADDSGLCVDALNGEPGVFSARYSDHLENGTLIHGTDATNIAKLLMEMKNIPSGKRGARFCCAMAACSPDGRTIVANGTWEGHIAFDLKGENGFGYDPVFICAECNCHAAELSQAEKNSRSHRAKALKNLLANWPNFWKGK